MFQDNFGLDTQQRVVGRYAGEMLEKQNQQERDYVQDQYGNNLGVENYAEIDEWGGIANYDPNDPILLDPTHPLNSNDQSASKLLAALSRAQWEDYKARFDPVLDELIAKATDPNAPEVAADRAAAQVKTSFNNAERGLDLEQSRLGLNLTPEQEAVQNRRLSLARAGTAVNAANEARIAKQDDQDRLKSGQAALSSIEGGAFDTREK